MLDAVRACFVQALNLDDRVASRITEVTTAADLPGWTSAAHLALVLELEQAFGVTFENEEIISLGSVAAILEQLSSKGVEKACT